MDKARQLRRVMLDLEGMEFEIMTIRAKVLDLKQAADEAGELYGYELKTVAHFLRESLRSFDHAHKALMERQEELQD
jgi:hypothetical protein